MMTATGNPPNKKEIAEFFRLGLRVGALDYSAAVRWADSVLLIEQKPDIQIVEVSLSGAGGVDKTITCLQEIRGVASQDMAARLLLAFCWRKIRTKQWPDERFACLLNSIRLSGEISEDLEHTLMNLDEDLWLAEEGVCGTVEEAMKAIREFSRSFEEYEKWLPPQVC